MADVRRLPGPIDIWEWQLHGACRGKDSELFFQPRENAALSGPAVRTGPKTSVANARFWASAGTRR